MGSSCLTCGLAIALVFPDRDIANFLVVADDLAVLGLVLISQVQPQDSSRSRASRHIRSASSMKSATRPARSSGLVHAVGCAGDAQVVPELVADLRR